MFIMLFSIKQGNLAKETLANLWYLVNVSTLQCFPLYSDTLHAYITLFSYIVYCSKVVLQIWYDVA